MYRTNDKNMSEKMHKNELIIEPSMVRELLLTQCPQWADLSLDRIRSSGTDNALFHLGDEFVVRMPRIDWASQSINKEYEWLPQLAPLLTLPISAPIFKGTPTADYPWSWLVSPWHDGANPAFEQSNEYADLAIDLAHFLNEFHALPVTNAPASRRGIPLNNMDEAVMECMQQLQGDVDTDKLIALWKQLITVPEWEHNSVWLHGDMLPGNILVTDKRLSAVIDFSDVGIGDPAVDCVIAWALLNGPSRQIFKNHIKLDENTWLRGQGWALSIAVIMLPYYKESNPVLAALARRMIGQLLP